MSLFRNFQKFFAADGGAGVSGPAATPAPPSPGPNPVTTPDITHDQGQGDYSGPRQIVGVDDILTSGKFEQKSPTTPEDVASIGAVPDEESQAGSAPATPAKADPIAELFSSFDETFGAPEKAAVPELPEGVDPKSAAAQIYRQQREQLQAAQQQTAQLQNQFRQMGLAYDRTVQEQRQQLALLQQQQQMMQQMVQNGGVQPGHPNFVPPDGSTPEMYAAYQSLARRVQEQLDQNYQPVLQQQQQQIAQLQQHIQQSQEQAQAAQRRQAFARKAQQALEQTVFKPAGIDPKQHPQVFRELLASAYAIGSRTGQPMEQCAKEAARQAMAFAKAWYGATAAKSSKAQQAMRSEPQHQPSGGQPLRGHGYPNAETLRANGYETSYDWELRGRPPLTRKPTEILEFQLGDGM